MRAFGKLQAMAGTAAIALHDNKAQKPLLRVGIPGIEGYLPDKIAGKR